MTPLEFPALYWYLLVPATLLFSGLLVFLATRLSGRRPQIPGLDRKIFHVGIFTAAVPAQLFLGFWGVVVYGTTLAVTILLALKRGRKSALYRVLGREEDGEQEGALVFVPLASTALGGLVSVLLVGEFAIVGYLACGWGDAGGELVGRTMGRHPYSPFFSLGRTPHRTVEGSIAVLFLGALGAWAALAILHFTFLPSMGIGLACGVAVMVGEAVSGKGTDNFWCQILPSLLAWWLLG